MDEKDQKIVSLQEKRRQHNKEVLNKTRPLEARIKHLEETIGRLIIVVDSLENKIDTQRKLYYEILRRIKNTLRLKD